MNNEFYLPDLGEGLTSAKIVEWHVNADDDVKVDQPLCSVETAKAIVEIPVPYSGKLICINASKGDDVATGDSLCQINPSKTRPAPIMAAARKNKASAKLSDNKTAMFNKLSNASKNIEKATLTELIKIKNKVTTAELAYAVARTISKVTIFNAAYSEKDGLTHYKSIDIGVAVQKGEELLIASINDCGLQDLASFELHLNSFKQQTAKEIAQKKYTARMLLSNIGSFGAGLYSTPSIMPPGLATIAIGRLILQPEWDEVSERWLPVKCLPVSLSFDHRIITGVDAATFLKHYKEQLS